MERVPRKQRIEGAIYLLLSLFIGGLFLLFARPSLQDIRAFYTWDNLSGMPELLLIVAVCSVGGFALWWMPQRGQRIALRGLNVGYGLLMLVGGGVFVCFAYSLYQTQVEVLGEVYSRDKSWVFRDQILTTSAIALVCFFAGLGTIFGSLRYDRLKRRWNGLFGIEPGRPTSANH